LYPQMKMTKKKYEIPELEIITLQSGYLMAMDGSYHDGGLGAPQRRSMPEGGDKAF